MNSWRVIDVAVLGATGYTGEEYGTGDAILDAFWAFLTMGASLPITGTGHALSKGNAQAPQATPVYDFTKIPEIQWAGDRTAKAEATRAAAMQRMAQVKQAERPKYTPFQKHSVSVPSFYLGEDDE